MAQRTTDHGPRTRSAITLTEVLISMGILTLGLLGVAAVFPVGSFFMQKAEIADRGSAIAQAVMNDIVANGMASPKSWYVMVPANPTINATQSSAANFVFVGIDGKYAPVNQPAAASFVDTTFTRPFGEVLARALISNANSTIISRQLGNALVIDPMYVAAITTPAGHPTNIVA
jgi:Tfp pilus assembly protein PilV